MKWIAVASTFALCCMESEGFQFTILPSTIDSASSTSTANSRQSRTPTRLFESDKPKGVYVRPSAVIEKGSGFFVPGLEGPRVRLVGGATILLLAAINHTLSSSNGFQYSEGLAILYSLIVLFQGVIESFREARVVSIASPSSSVAAADDSGIKASATELSQKWSPVTKIEDDKKERIQWAATSYISLTAATNVMMIGGPMKDIVYSLGTTSSVPDNVTEDTGNAVEAALQTISKSSSGLVALPSDHPAFSLAPEGNNRSVVLQSIQGTENDSSFCFMMTSDQLLASFTKQDLEWLRQLARYVEADE